MSVQRALPALALFILLAPYSVASGASIGTPPSRSIGDASERSADSCSIPELSIPRDDLLYISRHMAGKPADYFNVDDRLASAPETHWNAALDRAAGDLIAPPDGVHFRMTQTGGDPHSGLEGENNPNATLAAFELVVR